MTLQASGAISATDIHNEFQKGTTITTMWEHLGAALNTNTAPRGMPTGPLRYSDFYSKTAYAFNTIAWTGSFITTTLNNGVAQFRVRDDLTTVSTYATGTTLTIPSHSSQVTPSGYTQESWQAREVVMEMTYRTLYTPATSLRVYALVPAGYGDTVSLVEWRTWITSGFSGTSAWDTTWEVGITQNFRGTFQCDQAGRLWQHSVRFKVQPEHISQSSASSGIIMGVEESNGVNVNTRFIRMNLT